MRNCDGDPAFTRLVHHPKLPMGLRLKECPMRVLKDDRALADLALYGQVTRWRRMPRAGGLLAQRARDLAAFAVIDAVLQAPEVP